MTKAGQTCLTTCKIPMNERNLLLGLSGDQRRVSGALVFESVRESERATSTSSVIKFLDLKKPGYTRPLLLWDKRGGPPVPRDTRSKLRSFPLSERRATVQHPPKIEFLSSPRERERKVKISVELSDPGVFVHS